VASFFRIVDGFDFGMGLAKLPMKSLADHFAIADQDAADHRVRFDSALPLSRQTQGPSHPDFMILVHCVEFWIIRRVS
jgi:hypothetical protein